MTTIYVVTHGSYSDKGINGMFSTKENAEKYILRRKEHDPYYYRDVNDIEEYVLDDVAEDWLEGRVKCWRVWFECNSADVRFAELYDYHPFQEDRGFDDGHFIAWVYADTLERAVKVAMERRSVWLANLDLVGS